MANETTRGDGAILLEGIRVLDLATPRAELAGRMLADMGAEVIKVEPPGGTGARCLGPFADDDGRSLYWAFVGLGKKSVVLDIEGDAADRDRLHTLLAGADVLVESFDPGVMASLGLGYEQLKERYPHLVYASVSPFGQDGPWALRPATDLTVEAAGGLVGLQGDGDRPPIPVGYPQASFHGGVQAAADVLVALYERERSGLGQHLDVSQQGAVVWTLMNATGFPPNTGGDPPGTGAARATPLPTAASRNWPAADGYVVFGVLPTGLGLVHTMRFLRWMQEVGELNDWPEPDLVKWAAQRTEAAAEDMEAAALAMKPVAERIGAFIATRPKAELFAEAVKRDIMLAPLYTMAEVANDQQLAARNFWREIDGVKYPGPFAQFSATPLRIERAAPALGADQQILDAPRTGPAVTTGSGIRTDSFAGVKVADFAWVGVGPIVSKQLADHGATVVRIESATRPDVLRLGPPFKDGLPGINRSQFVANFNSSKLGLALNLTTPEGLAIAREMIEWADVVVESFTPGTLAKLGLDYESIKAKRPDIVMMSTCLRGQTGPERTYAGFGLQGACLSGLHLLTGWPDRPPAGTWGAYTDFINPRYGLAAVAAALRHRQRTGQGQLIDMAQSESAINFAGPLLLDYIVNGREAKAAGHDSLYACPHGTFKTDGVERYVAIAAETPEQWRALRSVAGLDAWAGPEFDTLAGRMAAKHAIEDALRAWCLPQEPFALADRLAAAGVPAAVVERPSDLYDDPQLTARGFFVTLEHTEMGPTPYDGLATKYSATPGSLRKAAPCIGEDTFYVLGELLALPEEKILEAATAGALE
ncbi:MAG: CaiB/BaiF CoA transferase family protein [Dehalococcoidia bacterium]